MENNNELIILENKNIDIKCDKNISQDFLYIIDGKNDIDLNLNLNSQKNSNVNINILSIANLDSKINIKVITNSSYDDSKIRINVYSYGFDKSKTNIFLSSSINSNAKNNDIIQNIFGLILSGESIISGQPILKIQTEQVIAKHSLKIGTLDKNELFYLNTKGFSEKNAKKIIIDTMLKRLLHNNEKFYEYIENIINERL